MISKVAGGFVDTVLGVSMAPTTVRMVLVEGENADGMTVDEDNFAVADSEDPATISAPDQVVAAILGTREGANAAGYELLSTGVTWTDQRAAAELRDVLAARKVENVMLVSSFLAAAALAQSMGSATGYSHNALLYVEPDSATLAVVNTTDGSIIDVQREQLPDDDDQAVAALVNLASVAEALDLQPEGLLVVGSGVDIPLIKPALEDATSLPLSVPEHPETALARGAALASANAPLFASSTAALAYALDPGTGSVSQHVDTPGYLAVAEAAVPSAEAGADALAYSAVADDSAAVYTATGPRRLRGRRRARRLHHRHVSRLPAVGARTRDSQTVFRGDGRADHFRRRRDGAGDFAGVQHPALGLHAAQPQPQRDSAGPDPGPAARSATRPGSRTRPGPCPGSSPGADSRGRSGPCAAAGVRACAAARVRAGTTARVCARAGAASRDRAHTDSARADPSRDSGACPAATGVGWSPRRTRLGWRLVAVTAVVPGWGHGGGGWGHGGFGGGSRRPRSLVTPGNRRSGHSRRVRPSVSSL